MELMAANELGGGLLPIEHELEADRAGGRRRRGGGGALHLVGKVGLFEIHRLKDPEIAHGSAWFPREFPRFRQQTLPFKEEGEEEEKGVWGILSENF